MTTIHKAIALSVLVLALASCNAVAPQPTATPSPSPTATSSPTSTSTPQPTSTPTKTPVPPTATPTEAALPVPSGEPLSEWEGIPVMPGAIAGGASGEGYVFSTEASPDEIKAYYDRALANLGWELFATGQGTTTTVLMMYMQGTEMLTITMIPQSDGVIHVLLLK